MKNLKKIIATILCMITAFSVMSISVSAATVSASLGYNEADNSGDYAYWNGSKVVKSSSTTKEEIKWMQAALNYCISKRGLSANKLSVDGSFGPASKKTTIEFQKAAGLSADGSFGPATIKKMKTVLNTGNSTTLKTTTSTIAEGKITTAQIKAVLNEYNYKSGKYWTVVSNKNYPGYSYCANSSSGSTYMSTDYSAGTKASNGQYYMSYNYGNCWQCAGFANFVMSKVTGSNPKNENNGWTKLKSASSLQVGDIVRSKSGHSSIVLTIDDKGNCTFAECWGSKGCIIKIGVGFNGSSSCKTLTEIKNKYGLNYIYRYNG